MVLRSMIGKGLGALVSLGAGLVVVQSLLAPSAEPSRASAVTDAAHGTAPTYTLSGRPAAVVRDVGPAAFPAVLSRGQVVMSRFVTALSSHGGPAVKVTRPGGAWSGHQAVVVWLSHSSLRLSLHPGVPTSYSGVWDPGASPHWTTTPVLTPVNRWQVGLAATFNGGFKITNGDSHGGYWDSGYGINAHAVVLKDPSGARTLTKGAESLVINNDGSWAIGTWNVQVHMTPAVRFVRQELLPLVDRSVVNPLTTSSACQQHWGKTIGGTCAPWRSGLGITAAGDLVYAAGHGLTPYQLAVILRQAGAVRAMQLDINTQWLSAIYYNSAGAAHGIRATPHVLVSPYYPASRYIIGSARAGTASNRDFFAAYLR
jgi:hypothetical protein